MPADAPTETEPAPGPDRACGGADRPDSPCVAVCSTLFDDVCRGCGRTAMEVAEWVFLDEGEKDAVWRRIRAQGYPRRG